MVRLAASVPGASWSERFAMLKRLNVSATGVGLPPDAPVEERVRVTETFRAAGVAMVQLGCYANLECLDERLLAGNRERLRMAIASAAELGVEAVVTGPGHMHPGLVEQVYAAHPDNWTTQAMDRLVASCEAIVPATEGTAVKLCLEPWSIHTLNSPAKLEELVRRVNHPGLRVLLDPVNLMDLQTYFCNGDVINDCFDRLGDNIWLVHAKDTLLDASKFTYYLSEARPGLGVLDYRTLLRRLAELPERTPLFIEHLRTMEEVEAACAYIRQVANEVGVAFQT